MENELNSDDIFEIIVNEPDLQKEMTIEELEKFVRPINSEISIKNISPLPPDINILNILGMDK